jgi:hypothetical protein
VLPLSLTLNNIRFTTGLDDSDMDILREHVFTADLLQGEEERQRAKLNQKQGVGRLVGARLPEGCLGMLEHNGLASITVTGVEPVSQVSLSHCTRNLSAKVCRSSGAFLRRLLCVDCTAAAHCYFGRELFIAQLLS